MAAYILIVKIPMISKRTIAITLSQGIACTKPADHMTWASMLMRL
jgi:hypothetical protein